MEVQMAEPTDSGYEPVNGMEMYWESFGSGGVPLVVVHGGVDLITMFGDLLEVLAMRRRGARDGRVLWDSAFVADCLQADEEDP